MASVYTPSRDTIPLNTGKLRADLKFYIWFESSPHKILYSQTGGLQHTDISQYRLRFGFSLLYHIVTGINRDWTIYISWYPSHGHSPLTLAPQISLYKVSKVYIKNINAVSCSVDPRIKLESGYPPTPSLLYIVHSVGQNRHLSHSSREPSIARTRLFTAIQYLL
jgi:hypothetical protein